jgi:hypothetical protein
MSATQRHRLRAGWVGTHGNDALPFAARARLRKQRRRVGTEAHDDFAFAHDAPASTPDSLRRLAELTSAVASQVTLSERHSVASEKHIGRAEGPARYVACEAPV